MSFLKAVAKASAQRGSVIPLIDKHLITQDLSEDRRDYKFHPSSIAQPNFCPREWSLYNYHPDGYEVKEGAIEPRIHRIFGNGHGVHSRIQKYLNDYLWGTWQRVRGYDQHGKILLDTTRGFKPSGQGWVYDELTVRHDPDNIIGSTDGLLRLPAGKWGIEIKSMNDDQFRWMKDAPKTVHKNQVLIYEHSLEWVRTNKNFPPMHGFDAEPLRGFILLYENKNTQELREFVVPFDAAEVAEFMDERRPRLHAALEFSRTGRHPECLCLSGKQTALCKAFPDDQALLSA